MSPRRPPIFGGGESARTQAEALSCRRVARANEEVKNRREAAAKASGVSGSRPVY